jgi:hypothetical protein
MAPADVQKFETRGGGVLVKIAKVIEKSRFRVTDAMNACVACEIEYGKVWQNHLSFVQVQNFNTN